MLAYSSIEHMGILAIGIGIGGMATFAALLHVINNGLTKVALFLSAGSIQAAYGSKSTEDVSGAIRRLPLSGGLFLAGFLAITGSPPFGPFVSEFTLLSAAFGDGQILVGSLFLALLFIVFLGMGVTILAVVQGRPSEHAAATSFRDSFWTGAPSLGLVSLVLMLGLYIPPPLSALLHEAAAFLEVG